MSSVVSSDKRYLCWNIFMLHFLEENEFDLINNDPNVTYSTWAERYSDRVCATFDELIRRSERNQAESREVARRQLIELDDHPTLVIPENEFPMSLSPSEVYQGLLQFAPPYGPSQDPFGDQIEYKRDLEFYTQDDEWIDFSDPESRSRTLSAISRSSPSVSLGELSSGAVSGSSSRASPSEQRPCDEPLPLPAAGTSAAVVLENAPEQPAPQPFSKVISRPVAPSAPVRRPSSGFASDFISSDNSPVSGAAAAAPASAPSGPMAYRQHRRRRPRSATMCNFCRNNGESPSVYTAHSTKDSNGYVSCPILYCHVCEACGATGAFAHTRSYCPMARVIRDIFNDDANMQMRYSNFAKTARDK